MDASTKCPAENGLLPSCVPLANPYVPFQQSDPNPYKPTRGLIRGTMFPGLDLPFMGMVNEREKPKTLLNQIQALSFASTELGEYLDTHPDDAEALSLFSAYRELYGELMAEYENENGPLTQLQCGMGGRYDWPENPWPWDYPEKEG